MDTPFQPEAFGRYYLVDKIAVGGMAEVFKAKTFSEGGFEKLLVIKRILQHLSGNDEFVDMFIDEAKISVELQHPNIVGVYDFGKLRDNYFIAMECVEGKDVKHILRKLAQRRKVLPPEYAVFIAHEVAKGLDYAHRKTNAKGEALGIIHRDISPSNILVSYDADVKIADFGIAKAEISVYNTKDGVLKGKFEYMSPEQASGRDVTPQSDIFSTGVILHEMLTGRRLFKTDSEIKTLEKIKAVDIKPPSAINPNVPRRLDDIVMTALARDPARRYPDGRALQVALLEYMYPSTPDVTKESLAYFLQELFATELSQERGRLEVGTAIAAQMWQDAPDENTNAGWEDNPSSQHTIQTPPARWPLLLGGVAIVLVAVVIVLLLLLRPQEPKVVQVEHVVEAPQPTHGSLQLSIDPPSDSRVLLDGAVVGTVQDGVFLYNELAADKDLQLRVEHEGYTPYEETVRVSAGERLRLPVRLHAVPTQVNPPPQQQTRPEPPPSSPPPAASPPTVSFSSSPAGARVFVDGRLVGTTPMRWTQGEPGSSHRVEYQLDGYQKRSFSLTTPAAGAAESFSRTLKQEQAAPGKVSVNLKSGWATVFIDGKRVDDTPLSKHALPAGSHTVRVVNEATGVDETRQVTIQSGETTRVMF